MSRCRPFRVTYWGNERLNAACWATRRHKYAPAYIRIPFRWYFTSVSKCEMYWCPNLIVHFTPHQQQTINKEEGLWHKSYQWHTGKPHLYCVSFQLSRPTLFQSCDKQVNRCISALVNSRNLRIFTDFLSRCWGFLYCVFQEGKKRVKMSRHHYAIIQVK